MRALAKTIKSTTQLVKTGDDSFSLNTTILLITKSQKFKLGGDATEVTTVDERKVKNVFAIEGNKLIEKQIGEKTLTIEREFFDDEMITKTTSGNVVCTSWSKLVD